MTLRIHIPDAPGEADRAAVLAPLRAYNIARAGDPANRPVALLLVDDQGRRLGGLWGRTAYDWMFVELLAVPERHRGSGLGTQLMAEAEKIARARGCVGIYLDTYDFQALGFYEKLGFELFGSLEDHPRGHSCFFLRKRL